MIYFSKRLNRAPVAIPAKLPSSWSTCGTFFASSPSDTRGMTTTNDFRDEGRRLHLNLDGDYSFASPDNANPPRLLVVIRQELNVNEKSQQRVVVSFLSLRKAC